MDVILGSAPSRDRAGHPARSVFRVLAGIVVGLVIAMVVVTVVATRFLGFRILAVRSGSMEPTLHVGDLIVTHPTSIMDVRQGEIVLFDEGTATRILVPHRVVSIGELTIAVHDAATGAVSYQHDRMLRTQGDHNPAPDAGGVTSSNFEGVYWFKVPGIGAWLGTGLRTILAGLALACAGAWAAYEALRFRGRRRVRGRHRRA